MIIFTFRELKCAWRQAGVAFETARNKSNAHRLLLFYAVETGLKAVLLKRESKQDSEGEFSEFQHDLNKLMDYLKVGKEYRLDSTISLDTLKHPPKQRRASCGELNQVWRYGAKAKEPSDQIIEEQLLAIQEWIEGELK